jgi:hypothetical protein
MNLDFVPSYRVFYDEAQASFFTQKLKEQGIEAWMVADSTVVDSNIIGAAATPIYRVKIEQKDFERVNKLLIQEAESKYTSIPEDHYLLQFTTRELEDILLRPHEWSSDDIVLARMILKTKPNNEAEVTDLDELSLKTMDPFAPKEWTNRELVMVYLSLLFFGMAGIVLGLMMWRSTKTLPDGTIIYSNSDEDRGHGKILILIGLAIFGLAFYGALKGKIY